MNPKVQGVADCRFVEDIMSKIEEMKELLHNLLRSLHNRAPRYHYKLTGDEPECLSRLLELDEAGVHHLLYKCGLLSDETPRKYKKRGVVDQHDMFAPCMILNFMKSKYSQEKDKLIRTKDFYLCIGKENNELILPSNQYGLTTIPDDETKKKKIHVLLILPPTIRLNRDEKETAEKLKVLVFQSMPMLVRRNQMNQSVKKASGGDYVD